MHTFENCNGVYVGKHWLMVKLVLIMLKLYCSSAETLGHLNQLVHVYQRSNSIPWWELSGVSVGSCWSVVKLWWSSVEILECYGACWSAVKQCWSSVETRGVYVGVCWSAISLCCSSMKTQGCLSWSMLISGQAVLILSGNSRVFMLECVDQQSVSVVPRWKLRGV